jgi:hypothetical protein
MSAEKRKPDHTLIVWCWIGLAVSTALHIVNFLGWSMGLVSDRVNNAITNQLSWIALEITAVGMIITSYAKRDVNSSGDNQ